MPMLILTGIALYVERILRQEIIFDSSALTCTVFAAHILNICRSRIAHIDEHTAPIMAVVVMPNSNSTVPSFTSIEGGSMEAGIHSICLICYSISSILIMLDFDPSGILDANRGMFSNPMMMSVSTIVLNCLFVGLTMQIPISEGTFMLPWKIMARSFLFVVLSLFWTYCIGIHDAGIMLHTRNYPYYYNPVAKKKYVQPFTPCQLRFLVLLFTDGWLLICTGAAMCIIMSRNISNLIQTVSSCSVFPDIESAATTSLPNLASSSGKDDAGSSIESNHREELEHGSSEQESAEQQQQDSDVVAMFRLAQKQQGRR